jgi:hypothetical protein
VGNGTICLMKVMFIIGKLSQVGPFGHVKMKCICQKLWQVSLAACRIRMWYPCIVVIDFFSRTRRRAAHLYILERKTEGLTKRETKPAMQESPEKHTQTP